MKLQLGLIEVIQETIERLNDAFLQELGIDTNTWLEMPDIPLRDNDNGDRVLGHYRWDGNDESWYFETAVVFSHADHVPPPGGSYVELSLVPPLDDKEPTA